MLQKVEYKRLKEAKVTFEQKTENLNENTAIARNKLSTMPELASLTLRLGFILKSL